MIINRKREAQEKICLCCNSRKSKKEKHRKTEEKHKRKSIEKSISQYERFKGITRDFIARGYK